MEIQGKYNTAIVFSENVDESSHSQITDFCNQEIFSNTTIRIMPDVHAGKGCVIGYTANLSDLVVPNLIGLDIGCGILSTNLGKYNPGYDKLDKFIRRSIPYGFERNKHADPDQFDEGFIAGLKDTCEHLGIKFYEHLKGIGSLGGGNHFIELAEDSEKNKWLLIHSGSRNFGLQVATWHQDKAIQNAREKEISIAKHFAYLKGPDREDYFRHMKVAQHYARLNRLEMTNRILMFFGIKEHAGQFETIHNYINFNDNIIRKGAISAHAGEQVLIPLNMRDGSLIATGKGNKEWNYSAPHGAGRRLSRTQAKKQLDMNEFRKSMKNVWSSTISEKTKDEAPMAYKPKREILELLDETVEIKEILKPVYNFKAE